MRTGEDRYARNAAVPAAALLAVLVAVLVGTGAWLASEYRPGIHSPLRWAHRGAAVLLVPVSLAFAVAAVSRRRRRWPAGVVVIVAVAAAFSTGMLLGWEQVVLRTGEVRDGYEGVFPPLADGVRLVVIDDTETSKAAYAVRLAEHLVVIPGLLVAAVGFLLRR